jgi:hypothetical protein
MYIGGDVTRSSVMIMTMAARGVWLCVVLMLAGVARAQTQVFTDQGTFLGATGAVPEPPIPDVGLVGRTGATYGLGHLTFSVSTTDTEVALFLGEVTTINPGNEVSLSSVEDLDIQIDHAVFGFGFFFVEGTGEGFCSVPCPCVDTTFRVRLLRLGAEVGTFEFNAPDNQLAFYGVRTCSPFDHVEFRDLSHACDNEVWGRFYLADGAAMCCGSPDFNCDGDIGTDADIESFFACLSGACPPPPCQASADFNGDGDVGTDSDIESFFRVLAGGNC